MERLYTNADMKMDMLFGALAAIVFNFFIQQVWIMGLLSGLAFIATWAWYSREKIYKRIETYAKIFLGKSLAEAREIGSLGMQAYEHGRLHLKIFANKFQLFTKKIVYRIEQKILSVRKAAL